VELFLRCPRCPGCCTKRFKISDANAEARMITSYEGSFGEQRYGGFIALSSGEFHEWTGPGR
jgi:hypothetical protein